MALISEQIRETTRNVCDSLDAVEAGTAPASGTPGSGSLAAGSPCSLTGLIDRLDDDGLQRLLTDAAALRSEADALITAGAGVVAKRSERPLGYSGLAQRQGHRTPAALVQALTGSSRSEASRQVRFGEAMSEADAATRLNTEAAPQSMPELPVPWFEPITRAVAGQILTCERASALMRGMGEPTERCDAEVMRQAAEELLADAAEASVDELTKRARQARDRIDPAGVAIRAEERYAGRTWRFSRNAQGARTAWVQFDDESAAWIDAIVGAGMRPRRGGPRFVDAVEAERAKALLDDPRTNDQLVFDLLMDALRAGAEADPSIAFGSRQPGVRVVITKEQLDTRDAGGNLTGIGFLEDTGEAVPGAFVERQLCNTGTREINVDETGCPLNVGREQRLFTAKQRVALSIRDGGCMVPGCDRPPSYTEAHHIQEWVADHGRTDIADGILLCRFDHMLIHNNHWKIRREGSVYWLVPPPSLDPDQTPIRMNSKSPLRYARAG